jgi:hypothetical protein
MLALVDYRLSDDDLEAVVLGQFLISSIVAPASIGVGPTLKLDDKEMEKVIVKGKFIVPPNGGFFTKNGTNNS